MLSSSSFELEICINFHFAQQKERTFMCIHSRFRNAQRSESRIEHFCIFYLCQCASAGSSLFLFLPIYLCSLLFVRTPLQRARDGGRSGECTQRIGPHLVQFNYLPHSTCELSRQSILSMQCHPYSCIRISVRFFHFLLFYFHCCISAETLLLVLVVFLH